MKKITLDLLISPRSPHDLPTISPQVFKEKVKEFREAVIKITGYRIDLPQNTKDSIYTVYFYDFDRRQVRDLPLDLP